MIRVCIGFSRAAPVVSSVAALSINRRASRPVAITHLALNQLEGIYTRPRHELQSTDFSFSRFLTPYLAAQRGWVIFCDCDFLFTTDIRNVLEGLDPTKAVYCVQHDYVPAHQVKMDGKRQATYPRKNWSSFMIFNCDHPDVRALTPAVVNSVTPAYLHRFEWVADDDAIGSLEIDWNFLEGEYAMPRTTPRVIHYTNGGPWFEQWQNCDYADLWLHERNLYLESIRAPEVRKAA